MNSLSAPPGNSNDCLVSRLHLVILGGFLLCAALSGMKFISTSPALEHSDWPEALLLLSAAAAAISSVSRTLPFQNVLWGALVIGLMGSVAHALGTLAMIPFGPYAYTSAAGPRLFGVLPWAIPLIWIAFLYSSRGVARLILQPWRRKPNYGFWLIGLTALLSLVLDFNFDPWASGVKHYWIWELTRFPYSWRGTPLTNFAGWLGTSALIAAFLSPMLINKKPGWNSPREFGSLLIWTVLNGLFITAQLSR